jgi:hypothetical protein
MMFTLMPASATASQKGGGERPDHELGEVGCRACGGHPEHVALGLAQVVEVDRHGLGPAEHEGGERERHDRQHDRAQPVDVLDRVQRHAPEHPGGGVAEAPRHVAVRGFVQRDREDHGQRVDEDCDEDVVEVHRPGPSPQPSPKGEGANVGHGFAKVFI